MELAAMLSLGFAFVMIMIRRLRACKDEKKPMDIVVMVVLGIALVCIILRRVGV